MANDHSPVNPLFATAPQAAKPAPRTPRVGRYAGVAVAAYLATAVATGYGVAAADTGSSAGSGGSSPSKTASHTSSTKLGRASSHTAHKKPTASTTASTTDTTSSPIATDNASPTTASAGSTGTERKTDKTDVKSVGNHSTSTTDDTADGATTQVQTKRSRVTTSKKHTATVRAAKTSASATNTAVAGTAAKPATPVSLAASVTHSTATTPSSGVVAATPVATTPTSSLTAATAATAVVTSSVKATTGGGIFGFLNHVVTNFLNPFLKPAPAGSGPLTPVIWAVFGWVRRNLFNQTPTVTYNAATTTQTGQTVTGNIGATDPEGDKLTYKITQQPQNGTVTIDQATGNFTYTPNDINYDAAQTDSFTVSVSDGNRFNLLNLFSRRTAKTTVDLTVLNPTVQRAILNLPDGIADPVNPRFTQDGTAIDFAATPTSGGRQEIYQINVDGTGAKCLTCGVTTSETGNLGKPVPFDDGSGRVLVLVQRPNATPQYDVLEDGVNGRQLVSISTPASPAGLIVVDPQREMRISPDGQYVLYSRILLDPTTGVLQIVPIVGTLTRTADGYQVDDAKVVNPTGEGKQWTPDGKGVIILGGAYDAGTAEDVEVDLATGKVTQVTANLDYNEDIDESPNEQWIAVGSMRGLDALTAMTRIVRPNFLPAYVGAAVYGEYATPVNVTNQEWAVAEEDELKGENGIPLFDTGDGWAARSMPSWNADGTAVTFWESGVADPTQSRLVIANLKYTTSVGTVATDRSTPAPTWAPSVGTYVPSTTPLPALGTYAGAGGGTAVISEAPDPANAGHTIRTVTYTNYVNTAGEILNGTESTNTTSGQSVVQYSADITVTGSHTGYLQADATINAFQQTLTGYITSDVDGDVQTIPNLPGATTAQQSA